MTATLADAKRTVADLLDMTGGDADAVFHALVRGERAVRQTADYTEEYAERTALMLLALTDITGNACYRNRQPAA